MCAACNLLRQGACDIPAHTSHTHPSQVTHTTPSHTSSPTPNSTPTTPSHPPPGLQSIPSADGIEHLPDSPNTRDVGRHKAVWNAQVDECTLLQSGGVLKSVTSHTGRDYWSPAEADDMFTSCLAHAAATGVTVREGG